MSEVLYLRHVDAVLDPAAEEVRHCTLAAVDGRCRLLDADDGGSLGPGRVVDAGGLVAVPGLIDAHVHWGAAAQERWTVTAPSAEEMGGEFAAFLPVERAACLELALFRQGGMTPGQALACGTTLPGALLPGGAVGRIQDGALADWVLVRGDPLRDLGVLRHPALVVQGGRIVAGSERKEWAA